MPLPPTKDEVIVELLASGRFWVDASGAVYSSASKSRVGSPMKNGYRQIMFKDSDGRLRRVYEHRLVWIALNGPIEAGLFINHKDSDPSNNSPENLELVSHRDNILHAHKAGRGYRAISREQVQEVRRLAAAGVGTMKISRDLGLNRQTVRRAITGATFASE